MRILIIEDEAKASDYLKELILELEPDSNILAQLACVSETVDWLKSNTADLIFLDIHLADGNSFQIFDQIEVTTPIIFTTAYDQYAIQAFKVNSIEYLLKPIEKEDLESALSKFRKLNDAFSVDLQTLKSLILERTKTTYQQRYLVQSGKRILSVRIQDVAYFEGEDRFTYLNKKDGKRYIVDYTLNDLESLLNPDLFFRLNRSFIAHFDAIETIIPYSNSRLKVHLLPKERRDVVVSYANVRRFKAWLNH